mmetsp:Transcript_43454/g.128572  ORF Transcript_43454/g.128572 Transcript_43454/m.128572 type:complete len:333 (+) Transcript_43454:43-1041(+)
MSPRCRRKAGWAAACSAAPRPRELFVEKLGDLGARVDLRLALPTEPGPDECAARERQVHRGAEERRPALVLDVPLVAPVPDSRARLELTGVRLLDPILNAHDDRLALRQLLILALRVGVLDPAQRGLRNLLRGRPHVVHVGLERVLPSGGVEVPQDSPGDVCVGRFQNVAVLPGEGVRDAEQAHLAEGLAAIAVHPVAPLRHRLRGRVLQAEVLQGLHLADAGAVWRPVFAAGDIRLGAQGGALRVLLLDQQVTPAIHEESQSPLRGVALRQLLRRLPSAHGVMRHSIQQEGDGGPKLQRGACHASVVVPLQHGAVRRHGEELGALHELLQL